MKFCKIISFLFILCFYQTNIKAQDIDTVNYLDYNAQILYEEDAEDEYEPSDEEQILQDESDKAREFVLHTEDLLNYAIYLIDNDSLTYNYAIYKDSEDIVEYQNQLSSLENINKRFVVVKSEGENTFTYCKEYIYNQNKAWDFIYERLYDENGKLILFIRHYNTYNSACAEVAFERSEYYWNTEGTLIRKTYEIFDSNNNPLNIEECWMEREFYDKIMELSSLYSLYSFPFLKENEEVNQ
ncbi:MAG: hypothetical protein IKV46_02770 [Bacteroidales bacterium]|nr:hypothetical protein [Bacteroidales bacterium]